MKTFYDKVPVLVTGGAGFIGSHLVQELVELGAHVTVLDNLSTGSWENLAPVHDRITFIQGDITHQDTCLRATYGNHIIFHLAAHVSIPLSMSDPHHCFTTNVHGTLQLLEASRLNNVDRFIAASSSAVYGAHEGICTETTPCQPTSPYGLSKLTSEQYCHQYTQFFGLKTVSLRYFNVYGSGQSPHGPYAAVVASFKERMRTNQAITLFGDGTQTRDFISVEQVVQATLEVAQADRMAGQSINVGTGIGTTLNELIATLRTAFPDWPGSIEQHPGRPGDIHFSVACVQKLQKALGKL
jgi:UDP-glucose 4-epimerase